MAEMHSKAPDFRGARWRQDLIAISIAIAEQAPSKFRPMSLRSASRWLNSCNASRKIDKTTAVTVTHSRRWRPFSRLNRPLNCHIRQVTKKNQGAWAALFSAIPSLFAVFSVVVCWSAIRLTRIKTNISACILWEGWCLDFVSDSPTYLFPRFPRYIKNAANSLKLMKFYAKFTLYFH